MGPSCGCRRGSAGIATSPCAVCRAAAGLTTRPDDHWDEPFEPDDEWALCCEAESALVLGLMGMVVVVLAPFALYYGAAALRRIVESERRCGEEHSHKWHAVAGTILGGVVVVGMVGLAAGLVVLALS